MSETAAPLPKIGRSRSFGRIVAQRHDPSSKVV
jgi:hypothetical protein